MTDSLFSTRYYSYPKLDEDIRDKMQHLRQSIAKLEANLITPDSVDKASKQTENQKGDFALENTVLAES